MARAWIEIPLASKKHPGRVALADLDDWPLLQKYNWYVQPQSSNEYARTNTWDPASRTGHGVLMHWLLTGWARTDHADGNGLNNQRSNLRPASASQNNGNRRPTRGASSRFKGVSWEVAAHRWRARIGVDGRIVSLGCFASEEDAARAYDAAAVRHFGDFAKTNFSQETRRAA